MQSTYKYKAFISYSHRDEKFGTWLHKALERYKIPKELREIHPNIPDSFYPIFRDREELPSSSSLSKNILNALRESHYLIVICSINSAKSFWVNQEIINFKTMNPDGENRVLPIILDGEPNASDKEGFSDELECFPKALKYKVVKGKFTNERTEPIAGDVRKGKEGRSFGLFKIVAGLLDVGLEEIYQREEKRKKKRWWKFIFVSSSIFSIISSLSVFIYMQSITIDKINYRIQELESYLQTMTTEEDNKTIAILNREIEYLKREKVSVIERINFFNKEEKKEIIEPFKIEKTKEKNQIDKDQSFPLEKEDSDLLAVTPTVFSEQENYKEPIILPKFKYSTVDIPQIQGKYILEQGVELASNIKSAIMVIEKLDEDDFGYYYVRKIGELPPTGFLGIFHYDRTKKKFVNKVKETDISTRIDDNIEIKFDGIKIETVFSISVGKRAIIWNQVDKNYQIDSELIKVFYDIKESYIQIYRDNKSLLNDENQIDRDFSNDMDILIPKVLQEDKNQADGDSLYDTDIIIPQVFQASDENRTDRDFSYENALKIAKKEHKIILLEVVSTECKFCEKMEREVLSTKRVQELIKDSFALAKVNIDDEKLPLGLTTQMTPMFVFVRENETVMDMRLGYIDESDFLKILRMNKNKSLE